jgi:hypothetical protein
MSKKCLSTHKSLPTFNFIRKIFCFPSQEYKECKSQIVSLTDKWYQAIRVDNNSEEDEDDGAADTVSQKTERTSSTATLNSSRGNMI